MAEDCVAQNADLRLLDQTDDELTLFARSANQIQTGAREKAISGNVMNDADLDQAMQGQDAVFVALSGNLELFAKKNHGCNGSRPCFTA
ncbi:NAD(P)H-binding protein [Lactobacillus sp. MRS-253-APC-2B]|uniref:NAD(P)H-binding protein n=1 Tax=Lactobacillus sp. MRS-253-APC-2B TaxID=2725305 RepID=UPI00146EF12B|nr:NAD(P)H-binding protein [Lactobacillus sp. MRS-253-APC-2B]NME34693.1 NAD(P)H-binding protein [Lactobacillus sp. MRS-253-APC-2B]